MLFFDAAEMFRFLCKQYDEQKKLGPVAVDIATYGISLFEEKFSWGCAPSNAINFMDRLRDGGVDVRILVGLPPVRKFKKAEYGIQEMEYRRKIYDVLQLGEQYGVCFLPTMKSHMKMYRINNLYQQSVYNRWNQFWKLLLG